MEMSTVGIYYTSYPQSCVDMQYAHLVSQKHFLGLRQYLSRYDGLPLSQPSWSCAEPIREDLLNVVRDPSSVMSATSDELVLDD